jgi:hypothetical protein
MDRIRVESVSAEEASYGVAELWCEDAMVAYTVYEDGDLTLRIQPRADGGQVILGVHELTAALAEVDRLLALH